MIAYRAFLTGTSVEMPDLEIDDDTIAIEHHGWVDPSWSIRELFESRNDVRPVGELYDRDLGDEYATVSEWVQAVVAEHFGAFHTDGCGTFYEDGSSQDFVTGIDWSYALHFHAKMQVNGVWKEIDLCTD